jgi:hypothetical protein
MASNTFSGHWRVRVTPIPEPITFVQLAERLNLPKPRVYVPKGRNNEVRYAWINDFINEEDAKEFARQWSGASISGVTIKCVAVPPKNDEPNPMGPSHEPSISGIKPVLHINRQPRSNRDPKEPSNNENPQTLPVPIMRISAAKSSGNTTKANDETQTIKPLSHTFDSNRKPTPDYHGSDQSPQRVQKPGKLLH